MERTVLRGHVASGIGDLARWMTQYAELFEQKTGVRLYPGSLNVILDEPWTVDDAATVWNRRSTACQ